MFTDRRVPLRGMLPIPARVAARAATNYEEDGTGCWITRYSTSTHGYGQVGWGETDRNYMTTTHRAAWTHHNGPIPDGATVDHLCRRRTCVRPDHLRLLSNVENGTDNGRVPGPDTELSDRTCGTCGARLYHYPKRGTYRCPPCTNARSRERQRRLKAERRAAKAAI